MKNLFLNIFAIAAILIFTGASAYASDGRLIASGTAPAGAGSATLGEASTDNQISVNLSKGVQLQYTSDAINYSAGTSHTAGNRDFATSDGQSTIWWVSCAASPCGYTAPTAGVAATWTPPNGWTSL